MIKSQATPLKCLTYFIIQHVQKLKIKNQFNCMHLYKLTKMLLLIKCVHLNSFRHEIQHMIFMAPNGAI